MNEEQQGALTGAATGAVAGSLFGPVGTGVGAVVGGAIGFMSAGSAADKAKAAERRRLKELERLRIKGISSQLDAQNSADQKLLALNSKAPSNTSGKTGALFGASSGTTGAQSSSTGTSIAGNF